MRHEKSSEWQPMHGRLVDGVIEQMDANFRKEAPLTESRGKEHDYLRMHFDLSHHSRNNRNSDKSSLLKWIALTWQVRQSPGTKNPQVGYLCDGRYYPSGIYCCPMHGLMPIRCPTGRILCFYYLVGSSAKGEREHNP
jgi:hypothetical protein